MLAMRFLVAYTCASLCGVVACGASNPPAAHPTPAEPPITVVDASAPPSAPPPAPAAETAPPAPKLHLSSKPIPLPGASGPVSLDYLVMDRKAGHLWIPAGGTGSVDLLEVASGKMTRIKGFATAEREAHGNKRVVGPSSASLGDGVVYVGNRANAQVCVIDAAKLTRGACTTLASSPDGLQYVASAKELWVTTPGDKSITVLDVASPGKIKPKTRIVVDGRPEGYAVDDARGVFYTNLEDKDKTLALDVKTHKVIATFESQCGQEGPRGLAVDGGRGLLFVACTDHVVVINDVAHAGTVLSKIDTGAGVDNIDYLDSRGQLFVPAGKAAILTILQVDDKGKLTIIGAGPTAQGGNTVVVGADGVAYVTDPEQGGVLAVSSAP
jgi:sugar lactone lactonase YvrE